MTHQKKSYYFSYPFNLINLLHDSILLFTKGRERGCAFHFHLLLSVDYHNAFFQKQGIKSKKFYINSSFSKQKIIQETRLGIFPERKSFPFNKKTCKNPFFFWVTFRIAQDSVKFRILSVICAMEQSLSRNTSIP